MGEGRRRDAVGVPEVRRKKETPEGRRRANCLASTHTRKPQTEEVTGRYTGERVRKERDGPAHYKATGHLRGANTHVDGSP